jgi:anti-sigma factor RsiW
MNCQTARNLLLTAEVAELQGRGDSELSRHLGSCGRCRALAAELVGTLGELRRELQAPEDSDIRSVRRAVLSAQRRRARARLLGRVVPLAAAAGLAGLLLARRGPPPGVRPAAVQEETLVHDVTVTAPPGRNLAVWHTDDPNIVVVWFF